MQKRLDAPARGLDPAATPALARIFGAFASMAHVSLIVLDATETDESVTRIEAWRRALADAGHEVELLPIGVEPTGFGVAGPAVPTTSLGRSADAARGLQHAAGDLLLVIDGTRAYTGEDLTAVAARLAEDPDRVVVADGSPRGWRRLFAVLLRPLTGSSDPFSGLIGIGSEVFREAEAGFRPVGRRFALEILARTRSRRPTDLPVAAARSKDFPSFQFDDFRHIKRLADDTLGNVSRLIQFCVVGASGMVVDLSFYALLQWVFARTSMAGVATPFGPPLNLVVARAIAIAVALTWNFTLNRYLTFSYARRGALARQFITYVLSNALGVALSFTLSLYLPRHIGYFARHTLTAALVGIVAATGISFSMSRWLVFRPRGSSSLPAPERAAEIAEPVGPKLG